MTEPEFDIRIDVPSPYEAGKYAIVRRSYKSAVDRFTCASHVCNDILCLLVSGKPELFPFSYVKQQSRTDSFMEAVCNTLIGFWISVAANYAILPLFGYTPKFTDSMAIAALFTIVSLLRSYILRRLFNGRSVWTALKTWWRESGIYF